MILNTHPENRKEMVKAICELTGMNAMYLFTPTYAYQVGPITVRRDGSIDCEDEAMLSTIKPMLIERGWLKAETQDEMPVATESSVDSKDMPETAAPISVEQMDITMPRHHSHDPIPKGQPPSASGTWFQTGCWRATPQPWL